VTGKRNPATPSWTARLCGRASKVVHADTWRQEGLRPSAGPAGTDRREAIVATTEAQRVSLNVIDRAMQKLLESILAEVCYLLMTGQA